MNYMICEVIKDVILLCDHFSFTNQSSSSLRRPAHDIDGASYVMQALAAGEPSLTARRKLLGCRAGYNDVLVYGKLKREPFMDYDDLKLPLPLKRSLLDMDFKSPTPFQSHMWPALLSLHHVVGIAESNRNNVPRILSYLLPILKHLVDLPQLYKELGQGNGVCKLEFLFD